MSEQERVFRRLDRNSESEWVVRNGLTYIRYQNGAHQHRSSMTLGELLRSSLLYEVYEPKQPDKLSGGRTCDEQTFAELTAFRTFHSAVMQRTQDTSNSKLPHAIFQADDELAKIVPRVRAET
jgi:hypothetical protein